jgi:neutral trehalase
LGDKPEVGDNFQALAAKRKHYLTLISGIRETGFYRDYDFVVSKRPRYFRWLGLPVIFQYRISEQARSRSKSCKEKFLQPGGLPQLVNTGQQWDSQTAGTVAMDGNQGLRNYGYTIVNTIKTRWVANKRVYKNTEKW